MIVNRRRTSTSQGAAGSSKPAANSPRAITEGTASGSLDKNRVAAPAYSWADVDSASLFLWSVKTYFVSSVELLVEVKAYTHSAEEIGLWRGKLYHGHAGSWQVASA
jgi:hypothetical protein